VAVGTLVLTGSWVERGVVVQEGEGGALMPQVWRVVLARCSRCGARVRVLPRELLAFKSFSLPVIERLCGRYIDPDPQGPGLFPEGPHPLCAWHGWLIDRFHVAAWAFPTGMACTSLELPPRQTDALQSAAQSKPPKKGRCHEARAPP
jgi:hypothetical protein